MFKKYRKMEEYSVENVNEEESIVSGDDLFGFDGNIFDNFPVLQDAEDQTDLSIDVAVNDSRYVVDGGYLIHRIVWGKRKNMLA